MKRHRALACCCFLWLMSFPAASQQLMDILEEDTLQTQYVSGTFFSTRIIHGHSIENPFPGDMIFIVSHRFGSIRLGGHELWGLDHATMRLGFEYGVNERLAFYIGRSSLEKTFDGSFKYKLLRQQHNPEGTPLTLSWFSGVSLRGQRWGAGQESLTFSDRLSYVSQLLIARRFSRSFSLQLSPSWVYQPLVAETGPPRHSFILGAGARYRLGDWVTLNSEYFYRLNTTAGLLFRNTFSAGVDLDTGGHVFQLHFSNAQPMFERGFLTQATGNWAKADIFFGFNIIRVFTLR